VESTDQSLVELPVGSVELTITPDPKVVPTHNDGDAHESELNPFGRPYGYWPSISCGAVNENVAASPEKCAISRPPRPAPPSGAASAAAQPSSASTADAIAARPAGACQCHPLADSRRDGR